MDLLTKIKGILQTEFKAMGLGYVETFSNGVIMLAVDDYDLYRSPRFSKIREVMSEELPHVRVAFCFLNSRFLKWEVIPIPEPPKPKVEEAKAKPKFLKYVRYKNGTRLTKIKKFSK